MTVGNTLNFSRVSLDKANEIAEDIKRVADKLGVAPSELTHIKYLTNGGKFTISHHSPLTELGGFRKVLSTYFPGSIDPASVMSLEAIKANQRSIIKSVGSGDIFLVELEKAIKKMPPVVWKGKPYRFGHSTLTTRSIGVVISDLHIGHDVNPEETTHKYGIVEEARTVAHITRTVCEYKMDYRKETDLHIFFLGDLIENILHGSYGQDLLHLQTCRAMYILTQALLHFSDNFKKIHVYCVPGNHDRDTAIHQSRAIHQKYNSIGTTIYYGIHNGVRHRNNIEWHQPKTPWLDVTIQGHRFYGTHGDTNFNIGNPGKAINTSIIENKMNRINASLKDRYEYKVFITGHVHTGLVMKMNNGCYLVVNGGGCTPDSYVTSLDIMESPQSQVLFEITEKYAVGDSRFIDMTGVLQDKSLDRIIKPFECLEK